MSWLSDYFKREKKEAPVLLQQPWQTQGQESMFGTAQAGATDLMRRAGQPYPGELTTPYEQKGLETLGGYLDRPLPTEDTLFAGARGELEKTFGGEYDPVGGTYYEAYKSAVLRELREAKDRLAAETSARDAYFGGGRIKETSELEEGATSTLAMELGRLFEAERERRLGAVPMATGLLGFQEQAPLQRVAASQQYGALPFEREYGDYVRQMQELGIPLEVAMNLVMNKPEYYQPGYEPSGFEREMQMAGEVAPYIAMEAMASDERIKENFIPIDNALEKLSHLEGKTYNYKFKDKDNRDAGIMAQDLEAILPEGIVEKDGVKYVKLDAIMALLVNAVNELQRKVG
ncbi:MAG: tail fiber domain-containing protein [Desulfobacterales bacterium]|nr:tail fiber domain-containing protein [Desulfobacterales bacterium]